MHCCPFITLTKGMGVGYTQHQLYGLRKKIGVFVLRGPLRSPKGTTKFIFMQKCGGQVTCSPHNIFVDA